MNCSYLEINDMVLMCKIGVPDEERLYPQKIFVTCRIYADFQRSESSDDIRDTVDYVGLVPKIQALVDNGEFRLIEHLADSIRLLVKGDKKVQRVDVQVRKPNVIQTIAHVAYTSVEPQ